MYTAFLVLFTLTGFYDAEAEPLHHTIECRSVRLCVDQINSIYRYIYRSSDTPDQICQGYQCYLKNTLEVLRCADDHLHVIIERVSALYHFICSDIGRNDAELMFQSSCASNFSLYGQDFKEPETCLHGNNEKRLPLNSYCYFVRDVMCNIKRTNENCGSIYSAFRRKILEIVLNVNTLVIEDDQCLTKTL